MARELTTKEKAKIAQEAKYDPSKPKPTWKERAPGLEPVIPQPVVPKRPPPSPEPPLPQPIIPQPPRPTAPAVGLAPIIPHPKTMPFKAPKGSQVIAKDVGGKALEYRAPSGEVYYTPRSIEWQKGYRTQKEYVKAQRVVEVDPATGCLLYTSPSPRDRQRSRMPSSA